VRIEGLVIREYYFRDPTKPKNPSPIQPPGDYVPYTLESFFSKYAMWIIIFGIIIVVFVFVVGFFANIGIFSMFRHLFKFAGGETQR